jgi:hypothetical protein
MAGGHDGDVRIGREGCFVAVEHAFRIEEGVVVDENHVGTARGVRPVIARRDALVVAELYILPAHEGRQEGRAVDLVCIVVHKNELDLGKS